MKLKGDEDKMKLKFTLDALKSDDPFTHTTSVPDSVRDAIKWHSARSPQEVMRFQDDLMNKLEAEASKMWSDALCTTSLLDHVHCVLSGLRELAPNGLTSATRRSRKWPNLYAAQCLKC